MYVQHAYGASSRELAVALALDQEHEPLERFSGDDKGVATRTIYIRTLLRWGVIRWNPSPKIKEPANHYSFIKDQRLWRNAATPLSAEQLEEQYANGT